jgi:hypothetical protein
MIMRIPYRVLILCIVLLSVSEVYTQEHIHTISVKGLYTSSSRLFPAADSDDPIARLRYNSLNHIFGYGADMRYGLDRIGMIVGLSVEYLAKSGDFLTRFESDDDIAFVPTVDGYYIIPIELTGYFLIPISSERLQFFIGGGAGVYLGRRFYEIADTRSESLERSIYPSIHVVSGIDYYFHPRIGMRVEMKFRDPDIETRNRFNEDTVTYGGEIYTLPEGDISSRINVDGIAFTLGLVFRF